MSNQDYIDRVNIMVAKATAYDKLMETLQGGNMARGKITVAELQHYLEDGLDNGTLKPKSPVVVVEDSGLTHFTSLVEDGLVSEGDKEVTSVLIFSAGGRNL